MAALIKKDFMLLKKYVLFIIVIMFALPAALAAKSNEVNMVQSTMAFAFEVIYSEFLICRYLAMKEYQYPKTASFLYTLPYTRNMQVGSKYLIYFIVFAFCCTAYWIDTLFVPNLIRLSSDLVIPVLFAVSILYSIYMPVQYKFGYDKSKLIFMFLFIAKANTTMIMEVLSNITIPVMLILTLAALALSVMVSAKIFNGKEL